MSKQHGSNRKLMSFALLVLGLLVVFFVYHFVAPDKNAPSTDSAPSDQSQAVEQIPANIVESAGGRDRLPLSPVEEQDINSNRAEENSPAESDSRLQEAELDHLSDVFLNSVYPSFQSGFQLDRDGRAAIDVFVASMPDGLGGDDLDAISAMIKAQLPAAEAEELAFIITQLYRLEQEEARLMDEGDPVMSMDGQLEAQKRLSQLRDEWFGPELSALLFSETDDAQPSADQRTAASLANGGIPEHLPEEQAEKQAELAGIEGAWEQRYQKFLAEKRVIDNAGLDQNEKDRQIESLLRQHYSAQELDAARAYDQTKK